ncbi:MAG: FAD-dependent oxidoreductase [Pseudomonadota bacterium]|nr:FAD-dependent oxidoreductase [Pseudomonadota bacterium]
MDGTPVTSHVTSKDVVSNASDPTFADPAGIAAGARRVDAVVIGGGPAGFRAARELSRRGRSVALLNAESWAPYNRVKLTPLLAGEVQFGAVAQPRDPVGDGRAHHYADMRAVAIDARARLVETASGRFFAYRDLVICTGSRAFVPAIPGIGARNVFTFRDADDAAALKARTLAARRVAVIGGGLLGLEAARGMAAHGAAVRVIEHEGRLMPRQLDDAASALLAARIEAMGIRVSLGCRVEEALAPSGAVSALRLSSGETALADTVVVCAGVRPETGLAAAAGLAVHRGIRVDGSMRASLPHVWAAGECAEVDGRVEGLVGPCLDQAETAARAICGEPAEFRRAAPATRLKVIGVEVFSIGDVEALAERAGVRSHVWSDPEAGLYRRVFVERGRLAGAIAIGPWAEMNRVQQAVASGLTALPLPLSAPVRFRRSGALWPASAPASAADWPDTATVCNCTGVTRGRLGDAIAGGAATVDALRFETGACTVCGTCEPLLDEILKGGAAAAKPVRWWRPLLALSGAAALIAAVTLAAPPIPLPDTFSAREGLERLWFDNVVKQWTGYILLGITLAAMALGLRKRIRPARRLGGYDGWRAVHLGLGGLAGLTLFAHTGFRFGDNLNAWLMGAFVAVLVLGAVAGLATGGEHKLRGRGLGSAANPPRRLPTWLHILALWPLPALIGAHVLAAYAW